MRELSGAIIGAAVIQIFIGYSGAMSVLLQYISPITIAPTIALVGLSLAGAGWGSATSGVGSCVEIGLPTILLFILFSQYLRHIRPRMFGGLPIFTLFPVLFAIGGAWLIARMRLLSALRIPVCCHHMYCCDLRAPFGCLASC